MKEEILTSVSLRQKLREEEQQQWTPDWLATFGSAENWLQEICEAHKAELDKTYDTCMKFWIAQNERQEREISVEREMRGRVEEALAAERQRLDVADRDRCRMSERICELDEAQPK